MTPQSPTHFSSCNSAHANHDIAYQYPSCSHSMDSDRPVSFRYLQQRLTAGLDPHRAHRRMDSVGLWMSSLCIIHCLAAPILALALPIAGLAHPFHEYFHFILALILWPMALWAFGVGYWCHRRIFILIAGIFGMILISISALSTPENYLPMFHFFSAIPHTLTTITGSLILVTAHLLNRAQKPCGLNLKNEAGS